MSEEKKIEKLFGDALKKFGAPPPDVLKNDIASQLKQRGFIKDDSNRKGYFRWFGAIALLVVVVASVYFLNENKSADNNILTEQNHQTTIETNQSSQNKTSTIPIISHSDANQIRIDKEKTEGTNSTSTSSETIQQKNEHDKSMTKSIGSSTDSKVASSSKKKSDSGKMISGNATALLVYQSKKNSTKKKHNKSSEQTEQISQAKKEGDNTIQNANASSLDQNSGNENSQSGNQNDTSTATSNSQQNDSIANAQALAEDEKEIQQKNDSIAKTLEEQHQKAVQDSLAKSQAKKSKFITGISLDVFGGPQWTNSKFSASESKYDSLTSELKNSETEKTSYSFGVGVNLAHNNLLLQPGINYSMLKSAFDYVNTQTSLDSSNSYYNYLDSMIITWDSLLQQWDTLTFHYDSTFVPVIDSLVTTVKSTTTNTVSILEIPLLFGYRYTEGKFDFEIRAGVSVGFVTSASGATYSPSTNKLITYNNVSNSPYRKSYWNFIANIYAVYNLNDRFAFFLQPAAKIGLSSIYKSDYPVTKNIKQYTIGVGVRFKF